MTECSAKLNVSFVWPTSPICSKGLLHRRETDKISGVLRRLDGAGESGEDRCEPIPPIDIPAGFIVTATKVLHKRLPSSDHRGVSARSCRIDQQRREPLHPAIDGHVIDVDTTLGQQLLMSR